MVLKQDINEAFNLINANSFVRMIVLWRSPGIHAVTTLRFGQWVDNQSILLKIFLTPVYIFAFHRIRAKWGIEVPRPTEVGEGFYIEHFGGIVVSPDARIGRHVHISQGVTIGVSGQGEKRGCPIIGDNVYIGPGAKIFGKITIGNGVKIGANAVVHKDIPDNSIVVLAPGFEILNKK